jgi:hypothetical protein
VSRITWDALGERFYELGVDRGVLYTPTGVAWTGLISVAENPSGGDAKPFYLDGQKYLNFSAAEEFEATIQAFSSPPEFGPCDGNAVVHNGLIATQQRRQSFGLSYRTMIGNPNDAETGYKLHLVYNALAAPSQRNNISMGGSGDPNTYSWDVTTRPPTITGYKPTAHLVIDSRTTDPSVLSDVEDLLYGTISTSASLPDPDDLIAMFA